MQLHELKAPRGARKRKKIVGRGRGSGFGKTAGRGENGQGSREGSGIKGMLEGGQMRLIRRLPKVGFRSHRPVFNQIVNVESLNKFTKDSVVSAETLKEKGLIKSLNKPFKILGTGELKKVLIIQAESVSKSAQEKIKKAGGKIEPVARKASEEIEKSQEKANN